MIKIDRFNVTDRVAFGLESVIDPEGMNTVYRYFDEDTNIQVKMHVAHWDETSKSEIVNEIAMRYITTLRTRYIVERKWAKKERLRMERLEEDE